MIDSFYLTDIDTSKTLYDTLHYIFKKSIFFDDTYLARLTSLRSSLGDKELNIETPSANEIVFLESLLKDSAKFFRTALKLELDEILHIKSEIKKDSKLLESVSHNLRDEKRHALSKILCRELELQELALNIDRKVKNNIILVGLPGVGKSFLVEKFALLNNLNILSINVASLIGNTRYRGEFEEKVDKVFQAILKYRLTVFIDEIHTVMGLGGADSGMSLNNILKSIITSPNIQLIGATTEEEFELFHKDKAFERRFNILKVKEFSKDEVISMFEHFFENVLAFYSGLVETPDILMEYLICEKEAIFNHLESMKHRHYPDKLVDFFDYSIAMYVQNHKLSDVQNKLEALFHG